MCDKFIILFDSLHVEICVANFIHMGQMFVFVFVLRVELCVRIRLGALSTTIITLALSVERDVNGFVGRYCFRQGFQTLKLPVIYRFTLYLHL